MTTLSMTRQERDSYLSAVHVGVISIERAGGRRSRCRSGTTTTQLSESG
jgi:hypothetical protein